MTTPQGQPQQPVPGQVSPDGQFVWTGNGWVPNPSLPKPKKKHTVRNVLIGVIIGFILLVGGCFALVGGVANEISNDIKDDAEKPGGTNNPLTIVAGRGFEVDGFKYADGWTLGAGALGDIEIGGLKVTNNRDKRDSSLVEIKLWSGTEVLGKADCTTEPINVGTTVTLNCFSGDDLPANYDKVTINDSF
ncbi:hypothetical protein [Antrihabitans stalactiti]|uniref:Uncharacterized protein n=1 Tax=Antrihabitans stalactiti TaxID=2584121 RepID=A0A848KFN0_9NOCA|nr:hypothetical protein [Antrihabitans stalactiti]NMN94747.1 hypothetical protein [Antrihabitans stalactiti]